MCSHASERCATTWYRPNLFLMLALVGGIALGWADLPIANATADAVAQLFINLLRLVSLPIIFLSLLATATGMESVGEAKLLGGRTVRYTVLTTLAAAALALSLFLVLDPVGKAAPMSTIVSAAPQTSYWSHLAQIIPTNIIKPFLDNNVIGVMFLAVVLSLAILTLPTDNRLQLHRLFHSLFLAVMKMTAWILVIMPLAVCAFAILFIGDLRRGLAVESLGLYLLCIVLANLLQAAIVLPIFLKAKGIDPWKTFKGMLPALSVAFFSKSSAATLPTALLCATDRVGLDRKVAHFTLPLCTTINMNGCAAFILTTVLYVSMSHGASYAPWELVAWVFIATLAAIGNASVPMGCYFLASALLAGMDMPLQLMGIILPFYTFIDMLETAINVWSDGCVAAMVDCDVSHSTEAVAMPPISEGESISAF
jgi:Na+/H+-dicarboxylate symporter